MVRGTATVARRHTQAEAAGPDDFGVVEILEDGVRAWLGQLPAYAGIAFLLHAPLFGLLLLPPLPKWLVAGVFAAAEVVVALLVKAALTRAVLDLHRGISADLRELLLDLNKQAPAVLFLGARILARAAGKMLQLVVPGLIYLSETFAAVPELIAEGTSPSAAVWRSKQLTRGARLPVFAIGGMSWTLGVALTFASGAHLGGNLVGPGWMIAYLCTRSLDTSLAAVLCATTYRHLCLRPDAV